MENKYRATITGLQGDAVIIYDKKVFKSVLISFEPVFTEEQLNWFLRHIPVDELMLTERLVLAAKGKINLDKVQEPASGSNRLIAFFCDLYKEKTGLAYKVSGSDAGKVKKLSVTDQEWTILVTTYFDSKNFLFVNKWSLANLIKYWNELRVEAFGNKKAEVKNYPLPYDHLFFVKLDMKGQQEYWEYLRQNGYKYEVNEGRIGKWVKK